MSYLSESGGSGLRDGQDRKRKVEYVGVGFPNPWARRTLPTMESAPQIVPHLAPEGRQVNREARKLEREQAKLDP